MTSSPVHPLDGFDPLTEGLGSGSEERTIFEEATKRIVLNILKSYTGYFDIFSELFQNSLDALDAKTKVEPKHQGKLWVELDISKGRIRVTDNGIGMNDAELRYCFRPSVSFKSRKESRGHKGVGATFLAYGFTNIQVSTKQGDVQFAVQLAGGREWTEDSSATRKRPRLEVVEFRAPELAMEFSGTCVEIIIGQGHRPDLLWWNATNATQWLQMFRMRTPLGGLYLSGKTPPQFHMELKVINSANEISHDSSDRVDYFYPHEMTEVLSKVHSVGEVQDEISKIDGDYTRLPAAYRNVSAIYEIWTADDLLKEGNAFWEKAFDSEDERLIRLHDVSVYGCFLSSAKSWTEYQHQVLKVRRSPLLIRGGLQIASDHMVQGDLSVIPLTSTIGYQANTHVVIHFRDGNPDMGRKVFQPEIKALAEKISRQTVNIFKRYLHLMREDTGSAPIPESTALWDWLMAQEEYRKANPFDFSFNGRSLSYVSVPQCEQDVIALFHELVGVGVLRGLKFLATTGIERYDCCYRTYYPPEEGFTFNLAAQPLGVSKSQISSKESRPFILEFKYNMDGLINDFEKEVKFIGDTHCAVCWTIGEQHLERYRVRSLLLGEEGSSRVVFGATHALYHERERRFDIICLKDLIDFLRNPDEVRAAHAQKFKD